MNPIIIRRFAVLLAFAGSFAAHAQTIQDVQKTMDSKDYRDALRTISDALARRDAKDEKTRYQLLMMRGECQLQLGQRMEAGSAFEGAAKSASNTAEAATARANIVLMKASPANKYMAKTGTAQIDILDSESRKQAFAALRDDLLSANQQKIDAAMHDDTLVPTMKILPMVLDIAYLEYATSGSAEKTHTELKQLGEHARSLMGGELSRIRHQTERAEDLSNSYLNNGRRGLTSTERDELKKSIDYVTQICHTAREARRRAIDLGFDGAPWEPIIADADDLLERQQGVLAIAQ